MIDALQPIIEKAWDDREALDPTDGAVREAVEAAILKLDSGELRVADKGSDGWTVYVTARGPVGTDGPLDRTAAEVTARGGTGIAVQCDHTDDEQIQALFRRIADEQGDRLDLLVNNVWAGPPGFAGFSEPFWQRPLSDWDSLVGLGLRAHYVASVEAAKLMEVLEPGVADAIDDQRGQSGIRLQHPASRGDTVGDVGELVRIGLGEIAHDVAAQKVAVEFGHAIDGV